MKLHSRKPLPRRLFLKGAGGVTLALPFLEASVSKAQGVQVPKRFVVWFTPCGVGAGSYPRSLDFAGTPYAALQPFASDLIVTRGISMVSISGQSTAPHPTQFGHMLTGDRVSTRDDDILSAANGSIDMFIADRMGSTPVKASLHGVVNMRNMSWYKPPSGAVTSVRAEQSPTAAFQRLFANVNPGAPVGGDPAADKQALRRASVLDAVRGAYQSLVCQVGGEDRMRLEAHMDYVRDMEQRIGGEAGEEEAVANCSVPGAPPALATTTIAAGRDLGRAHMEVLVSALACDITRVATLQWYSHTAVYSAPYNWGGAGSHHSASHASATALYDRLYAEELARFLGLLKAARAEDGSSLLNHTVVLCISELGISGVAHHAADIPIILAGSAGGYLRTGRYIDFIAAQRSSFKRAADWKAQQAPREYFRPFDVPHNNLFVELANAVAPPGAAPVTTFGRADVCTGGLPQLRA